jgi:Domain of Unknown Function (DUF1080)
MFLDFIATSRSGRAAILLAAIAGFQTASAEDSTWIQLFNGKDLSDWDIKFTKSALNVNFKNTFKVVDSAISIDYSEWTTFNGEFGHAANKTKPYSHYLLRVEYQVGQKQVAGGPGWAVQNNGLMLHSQSMATMTPNQDFPISLETQLLGAGNVESNKTNTMNLCTPGTAFYNTPTGGSVNGEHCVPSTATNRPAPGTWAWVSVSVMGDSIIRHYNQKSPTGTPVFTYYRPVYWAGFVLNPPSGTPANNTPLKSGYIAIQAETHPYKFRKIELLNLEGCMDKSSASYRTYFVKNNQAACATTGLHDRSSLPKETSLRRDGNGFDFQAGKQGILEVTDAFGRRLSEKSMAANEVTRVSLPQKGLYFVAWREGNIITRTKWANF